MRTPKLIATNLRAAALRRCVTDYGQLTSESLSMTETPFWKQSAAALLAELATTDGGLTSQEAARRLLRYGSNDATAPKRAPAWLRLSRLLANPLVIILLLASALSAATGDVASFVIIASIVLLSVLLDFAQESQAQNAFDALRQQVALRADVRRDSTESSLPVAQLVPGDMGFRRVCCTRGGAWRGRASCPWCQRRQQHLSRWRSCRRPEAPIESEVGGAGIMVIELPGDRRVRVDRHGDTDALRRVLLALGGARPRHCRHHVRSRYSLRWSE